jgi:predicted secreted hydrolase
MAKAASKLMGGLVFLCVCLGGCRGTSTAQDAASLDGVCLVPIGETRTPLPLQGERLGEGVGNQKLSPSPRPSPSRERESPGGHFFAVTGPCRLQFPQDHGSHPGYRTEWWYYTGNVHTPDGELFGFQLTFFRRQLSPPGAEAAWPQPPSPWRSQQLFLAHAALADIGGKTFYHAEHLSRTGPAIAGVLRERDDTSTVFLRDWYAQLGPRQHRLKATADDFSFDLNLRPEKEPVLHGDQGYSRKGSTPERASCYYSCTRLQTTGVLTIKGRQYPIQGSAWMDHEFSSAALEPGLVGWDWFSLQFDDHSELMIYRLRRDDGGASPASSGTHVDAAGQTTHLTADDFTVQVLDTWVSPHTGARYPARWQLKVPSLRLEVGIQPNLSDQEMRTPETTRITYWEGSVAVTGIARETPITGLGYVELTGYDRPFDAPL